MPKRRDDGLRAWMEAVTAPDPVASNLYSQERFRAFIERVNPRFKFYGYHRHLIEVAEAVVAGEIPWLMVWQPPGSSKSEVFSRLLPAWATSRNPRTHAAVCTYGATLAHGMTRDAREYAIEAGVSLSPAQRAKTSWKTTAGGHVWGAGFGGAVRGNRYHLGIVDDPHKGESEIWSDVKREAIYRWWESTWLNRGMLFTDDPISRIIVMQRLDERDLCGWLLTLPDADQWTILALDAVADRETRFVAEDCPARVITDDRLHGELLLPDKLGHDKLLQIARNPDVMAAQFQQRPRAVTGQILNPSWFPVYTPEQVPPLLLKLAAGDLAVSSKRAADLTCVGAGGLGQDLRIYLFRPYWERAEAPVTRQRIAAYCRMHQVPVLAMEAPALGLGYTQEIRAMPEMAGVSVIDSKADLDKVSRARSWSWLAEQGRVVLVEDGSGWTTKALDQMREFPRGRHDDLVDMVGHLMGAIRSSSSSMGGGGTAGATRVGFSSR